MLWKKLPAPFENHVHALLYIISKITDIPYSVVPRIELNGNSDHNDMFVTDLEGGPLDDKYRLLQLHMHWGKTSETGAEHLIDQQQHSGEVGKMAET